ncbi:sodium:proton antiporter [Tianweitania sp. BSSL-BM11]|uniref:Sodium:proton antiporter n=1 Tax=Tianweitania aestuarii TaxID=2814886 RepID=A0ABS5RYF2_9HYPH|nr:sodium:proton antiporter [Tianweitania aestuarii]MBS9722017.1 sodium:proton antiporter [Tianweitania aestuarii]
MISIQDISALLLVLSALFGWINHRFIHLPHATGLLVMGLLASLVLVGIEAVFPEELLYEEIARALRQIDFTQVVMEGMLAFLLFAGAINLNVRLLRSRAWQIAFLALIGTLISTAIVGLAFWWVAGLMDISIPLVWALLFGALISPTDPVAVLNVLKNVDVPDHVQIEMQGEALFNDGVGVVLFTLLLGFATGMGEDSFSVASAFEHLAFEAGGGIVLGLVTGYIAYRGMRAIDDFAVEVLITLALVAGTYAVAQRLGFSGPLAVVASGIVIGDLATRRAMSDRTQSYVSALWTLIDEVLNSVLFLLIGLEVIILRFEPTTMTLALVAVPLVLVARLIAVSTPVILFRWTGALSARNIPFLTWAGVRGGISVALALSLPDDPAKAAVLAATYAVVLFTIVVQGLTLGRVARRTWPGEKREPAAH